MNICFHFVKDKLQIANNGSFPGKKSTQTQPVLNIKSMNLFYTEETNWRVDRIDNLICSLYVFRELLKWALN